MTVKLLSRNAQGQDLVAPQTEFLSLLAASTIDAHLTKSAI